MQVVQIDDVRIEATQRTFDVLTKLGRTGVNRAHAILTTHSALTDQDDLVAMRLQEWTDQLFVTTEAIQSCAVEVSDAEIERTLKHGSTICGIGRYAVGM